MPSDPWIPVVNLAEKTGFVSTAYVYLFLFRLHAMAKWWELPIHWKRELAAPKASKARLESEAKGLSIHYLAEDFLSLVEDAGVGHRNN